MSEQREAILSAYKKLDEQECAEIKGMADVIVAEVKARSPNSKFNRESALEMLGAIGIHMIKKGDKE